MELKFEGAYDNISEAQLNFIRDVIHKRGFNDAKVTFNEVGGAGDNYASNVKRIIIQNEHEEFRMIAKFAPLQEAHRAMAQSDKIFKNESIMYTEILPKFKQLEEHANVPTEDRLRIPECYGTNIAIPDEVIILEDLAVPGFVMMDRFKPLSDECIRSVLKNFAILHALSYALKRNNLDLFYKYSDNLYDMWADMDVALFEQVKQYLVDLETTAAMMVQRDAKRLLKGCILESVTLLRKMKKHDAGSKQSVIIQGDSWTNNMLFKFDGEKLQQSVMIDYQLSKISNPTVDLSYFIFNCTNHKQRLQHFNEWIEYYHSELDKALYYHGLKANYVYPKDLLDADMKRYAKIMFGVSVMLASVTLLNNDDAAKLKEAMKNVSLEEVAFQNYSEEYTSMFANRVKGLVDSCLHFGFLS